MLILAIDPGTTESGMVVYAPNEHIVGEHRVMSNHELLALVEERTQSVVPTCLAIEMLASMGMAVGAEVFETCVWVGMFMHAWGYSEVVRVTRNQVKLHLCGSAKAKDQNVRQAIIDLFPSVGGGATPQIGTTKQPGPLFGMNSHMWPALGVALTVADMEKKRETARTANHRPALRGRPRVRL